MRRMHFACWVSKTTETRLTYVTFIACARRIWLRERIFILLSYVHFVSFIAVYTNCFSSSGDELAQPVERQRYKLDD